MGDAELNARRQQIAAQIRAQFNARLPDRMQRRADRLKDAMSRLGFPLTWTGLRRALRNAGYGIDKAAFMGVGAALKALEALVETNDRIRDQGGIKKASPSLRKLTGACGGPKPKKNIRIDGHYVRRFRKSLSLALRTQADFAKKCGFSVEVLREVELNGRGTMQTYIGIKKYPGIDPKKL